jgi:hypothetical protein
MIRFISGGSVTLRGPEGPAAVVSFVTEGSIMETIGKILAMTVHSQ